MSSETKKNNKQRNEGIKKQSHISSKKQDVDKKIEKLTSKRNNTKLLVGKLHGEVADSDEKISSNKVKQTGYSSNIEILQKQKKTNNLTMYII